MRKLAILGMYLFGMLMIDSVFAAQWLIQFNAPAPNLTYTWTFKVSLAFDWLTGSWLLNCDVKKTVFARKPIFSMAYIVNHSDTWMTFPVDSRVLKLRKWNYHLSCIITDLSRNTLLSTGSISFRVNPPPPIVYFANTPWNLIRNPTFIEKRGELPAYWKRWWYGRNDYTQDDLLTGLVSSGSLRSTITHYVSGDVKWYFYDVPVVGGKTYIYAQKYHTNIPVKLIVRYAMKDGNYAYDVLKELPITEWNYASAKLYFIVPKDALYLTIWNSLDREGSITIDDVLLLMSPGSQ
jgi:hypothetical protein